MNPERWQEIETVLHAALEVDERKRVGFLNKTCSGDPDLLEQVRSLLESLGQAGDFLEGAAAELHPDWPAQLAEGSDTRRRVGPYKLLGEIGQGGMSTVYLAVRDDREYEQRVAIKLIKRGLDTDSVLRRFRNERQILASLDHPNIARLYDGGTADDGRPYFVMELIEGTSLDDFCDHRRLSVVERIELVRQVSSAVHYAHKNLVVHRDIKPGNILVTDDGVPKLLDFGIAKLLDPESFSQTVDTTRPTMRPMTPRYASPEQLAGQQITTASDVYSLGVLLAKLLTGSVPGEWDAGSADSSCSALPEPESAPPCGRLPGDLETIVAMALREEPERRYDSVEQLSDDLGRYLEGRPVRAQRDTLGYRAGKFLRRQKVAVAVAAAFLLLVAGFLADRVRQVQETVRQRDRAELERDRAEQVSALLFDLFASFDPAEARGETVTARELLQRGALRVETELADQPLVQAAAFDTIGKVYQGLGLYDQALPLFDGALELRRAELGEDHLEVAASLAALGSLAAASADYPRSEELHRRALAIQRHQYGDEHPEVAATLTALTLALLRQGRYEEARGHQQEALEIQRQVLDEDDPALATSLCTLGHVLFEQGEARAAEELCREALEIRRRALGNDHPEVASSLFNLAIALARQGDFEGAEPLMREALAIRRKVFGEEHPDVASVLHGLGMLLVQTGGMEEAEGLLRRALAMRRELLGENHVDLAKNLSTLASLLRKRGDLEAAAALYREALDIGHRAIGRGHPGQAYALLELGQILMSLGRVGEAEPVLREAYEIRRRALPEASPLTALAATELGRCLTALERYPEAEAFLLEGHRLAAPEVAGAVD
ncbi:MAG: serine/threonine-protein kinase [Acidobacteriota bacterium]